MARLLLSGRGVAERAGALKKDCVRFVQDWVAATFGHVRPYVKENRGPAR